MTEISSTFTETPILSAYYNATKNLDDIYNVKRAQLDNTWIEFNENVAESLVFLYAFFVCLDKKVQDKTDNETDKKLSSSHISFYYDFIVSKPSNSIFTETQKESIQDLFPLTSIGIAKLSKELFSYVGNAPQGYNLIDDKDFKVKFQKLFHKAFSYYDFIFSGNEGIFANFSYNNKLFTKHQLIYLRVLDKNNLTLGDLREFCGKSIVINIDATLKFYANNKDSIDIEEINFLDVYRKFIEENRVSQNKLSLEIFTYILANKLWKVDKIYQSRPELLSKNNHKVESEYFNKLKTYIKEYIQAISSYYKKEIPERKLYQKISDLDSDFIHEYVLKYFLKDIQNKPLENITYTPTSELKYFKECNTVDIDKQIASSVLDYAINNDEYEKFKFYRVIAKAKQWKEISIIIDVLHERIYHKYRDKFTDVQYMGILRSGSFLAHALNILKIVKHNFTEVSQVSESLLTHPYLTVTPRVLLDRTNGNTKIIVYIDEAIKTGYGVTISHLYRKKILQRFNYSINSCDSIFVIADFKNYSKKINLNTSFMQCVPYSENIISKDLEYASLVSCEREFNEDKNEYDLTSEVPSRIKLGSEFDWFLFLKELKIKELKNIILNYAKEDDESYDFTKVIANSILLFIIGKQYATVMYNKYKDCDQLIFYAGSMEGKLLIDITVFIYKVLYPDSSEKQTFFINGKNYNKSIGDNSVCLFFDLTYITGRTCKKIYDLDVNKKIKQQKKDFDYKFVLYSDKNGDDTIYEIKN